MVPLNLLCKTIYRTVVVYGLLFVSGTAYAEPLSLFDPLVPHKSPTSLYINTQTMLSNDAFSLQALFDDFHGKFYEQEGDYSAIGDIRYDMGTHIEGVGYFGYVYRKEAVIKASHDTMHFIYQVSNELPLNVNEQYDVALEIEGFAAHGLTFANRHTLYAKVDIEWSIGYAVEMLYASEAQHGNAVGSAVALGEKDYDFHWRSDYLYTDNYLYDYDVSSGHGFGYTSHVALQFRYRQLSASIISNDLMGRIYWKNLPVSQVSISSANKSYDVNGYAQYEPLVSGYEGKIDYIQKLMRKWRVKLAYAYTDSDSYEVGMDHMYGCDLPYIQYAHIFTEDLAMQVSYETFFSMVGIDVKYKNLKAAIYTNHLTNPSAMKFDLAYTYQF